MVGVAVVVRHAIEIGGFGTQTGETQSERAKFQNIDIADGDQVVRKSAFSAPCLHVCLQGITTSSDSK